MTCHSKAIYFNRAYNRPLAATRGQHLKRGASLMNNDVMKRKLRQQMQRATDEQFWDLMDTYFGDAYMLGIKHMTEAMECTKGITKKQRDVVYIKANEILQEWDGITIQTQVVQA